MEENHNILKGLIWKLMERIGVQGLQFIVQLILARMLDPTHYGALSIMVIFTTLANVFIQNGLNTALIQNKEVKSEDYSTVFWVSLAGAFLLYIIIFVSAPIIALAYNIPEIVAPLRILAIMLFPGALNSVQLSKITREMDFKKVFFSSIGGLITSGIISIIMAYTGFGLWSLVAQQLINVSVTCAVMFALVDWKPRFVFNMRRLNVLFSFGWKIMISGFIDTLYQEVRGLVIGFKYSTDVLGFYNRGKQFPQYAINSINNTVQSVLLPAMSAKQEETVKLKKLMRKSIIMSSYVVFPIMAGLAGVATPLVKVLLTEKWLPCVPYMQIYCFSLAFFPVHSCNLQAINAMGRSDIFLKLEFIKKSIGITALTIAVFCFDSPIAIAMTGVFTTVISCFINAYPNKSLINYSYCEQIKDISPSFFASLAMLFCILSVRKLEISATPTLIIQIIVGVLFYLFVSIILRLEPIMIINDTLKSVLSKRCLVGKESRNI